MVWERGFSLFYFFFLMLWSYPGCQTAIHRHKVKTIEPCSPKNLNLFNSSNGEFILLNDGSFRYQLPHCRLRRFKVAEAAKCLRGLHLVFMGDSLARYFYMAFAALFAHGHWPLHFISSYPNQRSFLSEKEYNSWSWFYQDSNHMLNRGKHAIEVCDCGRNDSLSFDEFCRNMFENRHFRYIPDGNLDDQNNDLRLSYIQWWGLMPMRGRRGISLRIPRNSSLPQFLIQQNQKLCPNNQQSFWPLSLNCSDQRPDYDKINFPDFSYREQCANWPEPTIDEHTKEDRCQRFEKAILAKMGTTHLLLNTGWHAGLRHLGPNFLAKLADAAPKYFAAIPSDSQVVLPRVTWRQCTRGAVWEDHDQDAKNFSKVFGYDQLGFFAVGEITDKLYKIEHLLKGKKHDELKRVIKTNVHWPKDREVNASTIHLIWHDNAHFEPYVYNEINNLFLNAVCPAEVKE